MSGINYEKDGFHYVVPSVDVTEVYNDGFAKGKAEGKSECEGKHFVGTFIGDGTGTAKFLVPFKPDCISVYGMSPFNYKRAHSVAYFTADLKTFGYIGAACGAHRSNGNVMSAPITTKSIPNVYQQDADGWVTLSGLVGDGGLGLGKFPADTEYIVVAAKYTDKTDKQYLDDFVLSLDASSEAVTLSKERVDTVYPNASSGENSDWIDLLNIRDEGGTVIGQRAIALL